MRQSWGGWAFLAVAAGVGLTAGGAARLPAWSSPSSVPAPAISPAHPSSLNPHPSPTAVPAYAPDGSRAEVEVIEAARLIGIPVTRAARFPSDSPVAFFCASALSDRQLPQRLRSFVSAGGRALVTSRVASRLGRLPSDFAGRLFVLPSDNGPAGVFRLPQAQVDRLRNFVLYPLGLRMEAPPRVSLTLLGRRVLVVENHNPYAAGVKLTFIPDKWPAIQCLSSEGAELPLVGRSIALQTPPKAAERFQIVSR
jgi:hypothetical protein